MSNPQVGMPRIAPCFELVPVLTGRCPLLPHIQAQSAIFRGDNDILVDHLVFASHQHKNATAVEGVFGRALTPYFAEGEDLRPIPNRWGADRTESSMHDVDVSNVAHLADERANTVPFRQFQSAGSPPRSSSQVKSLKTPPPQASKRSSKTSRDGTPSSARSQKVVPSCPGFFSSPRPNEVPMPSRMFMAKATANASACKMPSAAPTTVFTAGFSMPMAAA